MKIDKQLWLQTPHYCKSCGKQITELFGNGNYCSRSCANKRTVTDKVKQSIKAGIKKSAKWASYLNAISNGEHVSNKISYTGYYHGVFCASTGELAYYIYCLDHGILIERCKDYFIYEYNNALHNYLPDGYLPAENKYIEIKGKIKQRQIYNEEIIQAKATAMFNYNLNYEIIDDSKIKPYLKYCKQQYKVKDLQCLYDDQILTESISKVHNARTANYKGINNTEVNSLVPEALVDDYLARGGIKGRIKKEPTQKMIDAGKRQKKVTNIEKPQKLFTSEFRKGRKQMYKEDTRIFVLPDEVAQYLANGGKLGTGHKQKSDHHSGGNHKAILK